MSTYPARDVGDIYQSWLHKKIDAATAMEQNNYALARMRTRQHLKDEGIVHHMFHGPVTDEYWSVPLRVLAVNMESYGYDECGHWEVDLPCLLDWMYDRGGTGTKTVRYTLAIVRTLFDAYSNGAFPTEDQLRLAYADAPRLEAVARQIAYYNIRSTSNANKEQDVENIIASGSATVARFTHDEMKALEPQVVLVSGRAGLTAFNAMWQLNPELQFLEKRRDASGTMLQSIRHPSRPNYQEYISMIGSLVQDLH